MGCVKLDDFGIGGTGHCDTLGQPGHLCRSSIAGDQLAPGPVGFQQCGQMQTFPARSRAHVQTVQRCSIGNLHEAIDECADSYNACKVLGKEEAAIDLGKGGHPAIPSLDLLDGQSLGIRCKDLIARLKREYEREY